MQKLSRLQRRILAMALANRVREGRTDASRGADLYYAEILATVYGFPYANSAVLERDGKRLPGHQVFDRQAIGQARYNRAQAAVSRAMRRLADRGLIHWMFGAISRWSGCSLSEAGLAASQTVNTKAKLPEY